MTETLSVVSERVDAIPLVLAQMERMGIAELLDDHFPTHGNWEGLSRGRVATGWLSHLLSQGDHRLSHVQDWAGQHLTTLQDRLGQPVRALDWSDDRLATVRAALSDDARWAAYEAAQTGHLVRVYDLVTERVRLDSTTGSSYHTVTPDGLFQFGHRKDHRPDLPQVEVLLGTLDPLGLPVATDVLPGQCADDPLSVPAIRRVQATLGRPGLLSVGDAKMAALETRATLAAAGDYYRCPLPAVQLPPAQLDAYLAPVWAGTQAGTPVVRAQADGTPECLAEGFVREAPLTAVVAGATVTWTERRLVLRSLQQAERETAALHARRRQAQAALATLNERRRGKRRYRDVATLRQAAEAIVAQQRVAGLLCLSDEAGAAPPRAGHVRGHPASSRSGPDLRVTVLLDEVAVIEAVRRRGWRVSAANAPAPVLALEQAVLAYRGAYLIERGFGRLKGRPLSRTPLYLARDDQVTGLLRLLSIGLRVLTLVEFVTRRALAATNATLAGLAAGNPTRATARPTTEALLRAFK